MTTKTSQSQAPAAPTQVNNTLSNPNTNMYGQQPGQCVYPPNMMPAQGQYPPNMMPVPVQMQQKGENGEPAQMYYMMQPNAMQNNQQTAEPVEQKKADPGSATQN